MPAVSSQEESIAPIFFLFSSSCLAPLKKIGHRRLWLGVRIAIVCGCWWWPTNTPSNHIYIYCLTNETHHPESGACDMCDLVCAYIYDEERPIRSVRCLQIGTSWLFPNCVVTPFSPQIIALAARNLDYGVGWKWMRSPCGLWILLLFHIYIYIYIHFASPLRCAALWLQTIWWRLGTH